MTATLSRDSETTPEGTNPSESGSSGTVEPGEARRPRIWPLMAVFGSLLAILGARALSDNSLLTHLATGRLILDSGLPSSNPFLYTGTSFPVPSYLWSIVLAVTESAFGGTGLRLMTAAVAGLLGVLIVRLTITDSRSDFMGQRSDPGLLAILTPVVLTWFCLISFISARPHLPGFVLLALLLLVWKERRSAWLMVPLFAVWVNVHGTWLYGLGVLGLYVIAEAIDDRRLNRRVFELIGASVLGTVIGGAIYPDRFAVMLLPTRQFGNPVEREALTLYREWRPVQMGDPQLWLMIGLALIAVYGCLRNRRYAMTGAVVLLVLVGFSGFRLVPIAAIALVPLAALGLEQVGSIRMPTGKAVVATTALAVVLALIAVSSALIGPNYDTSRYPVKAVDWLEQRGAIGGDVHTVSHDYVGNYLEWRFGADANTYVDDRPDAQTFLDYVSLLRLRPGWQKVLDKADGDVIIWKSASRLVPKLEADPNWIEATTQGEFTVFCSKEMASRCS